MYTSLRQYKQYNIKSRELNFDYENKMDNMGVKKLLLSVMTLIIFFALLTLFINYIKPLYLSIIFIIIIFIILLIIYLIIMKYIYYKENIIKDKTNMTIYDNYLYENNDYGIKNYLYNDYV